MAKPHILICDDELGVRESLRVVLGREYELTFAEDGEEAVRYIEKHTPDLVILDVKMPKMDGLEALKKIKEITRFVCVLMLTGYESRDVADQATDLGACGYLTKPVEGKKVLARVKEILAHRTGE